jgi:hypothetical protein
VKKGRIQAEKRQIFLNLEIARQANQIARRANQSTGGQVIFFSAGFTP